MSLVQNFCKNASGKNASVRFAGLALATFTAVASLSGCAAVSGIPVGRVVTQSVNADILDLKRGAAAAVKPSPRFRACRNETGIPTMTVGEPCPSDKKVPDYSPRRAPE